LINCFDSRFDYFIATQLFKHLPLGKSYNLQVRASNVAARNLYTKMGFVENGVLKDYYENPVEDGIAMYNQSIKNQ